MTTPENDVRQRFIFDNSDIRGEILSLQESYQTVLRQTRYPPPIAHLIGEFLAGACLLSATLKFDGIFSLQASGTGPLSMIMADCTHHHDIRAIAHYQSERFENPDNPVNQIPYQLHELLGKNATLAVTIDPAKGERYQSIIPVEGETLSECLTNYFNQSEQLPTSIWLRANQQRVGGLLLQALPTDLQNPEEKLRYWHHLSLLAQTLGPAEQLQLSHAEQLHRLFNDQSLRLFPPSDVRFACSCSTERTANMLRALGQQEVAAMLEETDPIEVGCQFCHRLYHFREKDMKRLFGHNAPTLH